MTDTPSLAKRQVAVRNHLIEALHIDLVGPMREDEALPNPPSRWYLTGFLVPAGAPEDQRVDALADEGMEMELDGAQEEVADDVKPTRSFLPSSIGLSFQVPTDVTTLEVVTRWGDYEELDEQSTRELWEREQQRRREARGDGPMASPSDEDDKEIKFRYWRRQRTFERVVPLEITGNEGAKNIDGGNGVYLQWVARPTPSGEASAISLFLVNGRDAITGTAADERTLFQATLEVRCSSGFVPRYRTVTTDHPDDLRNDLQFRNHCEWAVGHGVAVAPDAAGDSCQRITTTWLPTARVHRMSARQVDGVELRMDALGEATPDQLDAQMAPLFTEYEAWIDGQAGRLGELGDRRAATAQHLLDEARRTLARMKEGIDTLRNDAEALFAFQLANRAMAAAARKQRPDDPEPRWRLFQLAFVLLNLTGVADPEHADRDRVELLFFPTGGGKTEAYLGVAAFTLVLRRLRHRKTEHEGAGVAVLLRYTLRLLTLDQLRRAAQLVCALELERRADPARLGRPRFSIGLWVGKSASANRMEDVKTPVRQLKEHGAVRSGPPPVPLASCPWCDHPLEGEGFELVPDGRNPTSLVVACTNYGPDDDPHAEPCPFTFESDPEAPPHQDGLPIVVVDEQLYRELPSIVVGTVDKFASLPWRGAVGMLFGRARALADDGFYGDHEPKSIPKGAVPLKHGVPPPDLIIQDELHLITGPLGTMVGLYETAIDAICRDRGHGPKIVASTATAARATEQIRAIFGRPDVHLFPPQGIDEGNTFFAELDKRPEKTRRYVGVAAPGRSAKLLAARTYTTLLGAAQKHFNAWKNADGKPMFGQTNAADTYMTLAAYFNALKELGGAQRLVQEDVAQRVEQLDERRPLDEDASALFDRRSLNFDILELTSRQSTDRIAKAIERLNKSYRPRTRYQTDVLLASSMISVGVDIGRLGLMVVNGQPRTTAEYIQASSRVGRSTPGLVVTALNLYKPRDRSHYERFTAYHETFYRDVEAASVTPFSTRAVHRGLAGLVVGLVRHLGPRMAPSAAVGHIRHAELDGFEEKVIELLVARAQGHRDHVDPKVLGKLREHVAAVVKDWRELVRRREEAGTLTLKYSAWERKPAKYEPLLRTAVDGLPLHNRDLLDRFRAPTSMRDVEPGVDVWVDLPQVPSTDSKTKKVSKETSP